MENNKTIFKLGLSTSALIIISFWLCSGSPDVIDAIIYWITSGYYHVK